MRTALMFPGQGSQYVGMGRRAYEGFPSVKERFAQAEDALGRVLARVVLEGPEDELTETANAQPALLVTAFALYELLEERGLSPDVAFGHSLGEFTALVAAGALGFEEAVRLVGRRGELMSEAGQRFPGTMAAVLGMEEQPLRELISRAAGEVVIANYNAPGQLVISGEREAVLWAVERLKEQGVRAIVLRVSAAFHSPLMDEPAREFGAYLDEVDLADPSFPVGMNATGRYAASAGEVRSALKRQLRSPVRFTDILRGSEADLFVEVGPGKVLSGLAGRTLEGVKALSLEHPDELALAMTD